MHGGQHFKAEHAVREEILDAGKVGPSRERTAITRARSDRGLRHRKPPKERSRCLCLRGADVEAGTERQSKRREGFACAPTYLPRSHCLFFLQN